MSALLLWKSCQLANAPCMADLCLAYRLKSKHLNSSSNCDTNAPSLRWHLISLLLPSLYTDPRMGSMLVKASPQTHMNPSHLNRLSNRSSESRLCLTSQYSKSHTRHSNCCAHEWPSKEPLLRLQANQLKILYTDLLKSVLLDRSDKNLS
ncbi:hypothetical protein D3C87_1469440 [compost metagenome]